MPKVTKAGVLDAPAPGGAPATVTTTVEFPEKISAPREKEKIEFWSYIAKLSPQDWGRHIVYCYRTKPVVGMGANGKYLAKYQEAFTPDDIRSWFGGEEFKFLLQKDRVLIHTETLAIEAAPKFDTRENPPTGAAQAGALERVMEKLIDRDRDAAEGDSLTNKAAEGAIDMVTKAYETVLTRTSGQGTNGKTDDNDLVKVLLLKLLDRNPVKDMMESLAMARELGLLPAKAAETQNATSVLGQVKEVLGLVKELGGEMGMGGSRRGGGGLAEVIMEKAPELIEKGVEALGKYAEIKGRDNEALQIRANAATRIAAINRGAQPQAQGEIPQAMPGGAPRSPAPMPGTSGVAGSGGNGGAGGLDLEPVDAAPAYIPPAAPQTEPEADAFLFGFFKARVVQLIAEGSTGEDIVAFAQDFDPRIYQLLEDGSPEGLRQFFAADPILKSAMALPRWEAFFAEACNDLYGAAVPAEPIKPN